MDNKIPEEISFFHQKFTDFTSLTSFFNKKLKRQFP